MSAHVAISLTRVDSKIQYVDEENSNNDGSGFGGLSIMVNAKRTKDVGDNLSRPCQTDQRKDGSDCSANYEGPSLAPLGAAAITLYTNIRLDKSARQGTSYPNEGQERLADAQTKEIGLRRSRQQGISDCRATSSGNVPSHWTIRQTRLSAG